MKQFNTSVLIGRFQLPHVGHKKLIEKAAEIADNIVIVVGSVGQPKTPKNPFSFDERKEMLLKLVPSNVTCEILPVRDQRYNNNNWVVDVVNKVRSTLPKAWSDKPPRVALVGHKKDVSSFYLDMFPQWKFVRSENHDGVNATDVRNQLYNYPSMTGINIPEELQEHINEWKLSEGFREIQEEHDFITDYKKQWQDSPFPPTFVTVDAIVVQSGHLLMVQRKTAPGKGLWALPGGFLNEGESLKEAVLRELREETKIKLQSIVLERSITREKVYDHPDRSLRGRTITHAFLLELRGGDLPRITGSSDAEKAQWIPLNEVFMMGNEIFEDHLDIILDMVK